MSDTRLRSSDWLRGGFPGAKSVTKKQRLFLNRRAHLLVKVLNKEEQVALRMMRFEYWLKNLSITDASAIICKIRMFEEQEKKNRIAKGLARKAGSRRDFSGNTCSVCGGELDEDDPVAPICKNCGKGAIRVQL